MKLFKATFKQGHLYYEEVNVHNYDVVKISDYFGNPYSIVWRGRVVYVVELLPHHENPEQLEFYMFPLGTYRVFMQLNNFEFRALLDAVLEVKPKPKPKQAPIKRYKFRR